MKILLYFILAVAFIFGGFSAFWWMSEDMPLDEQIDYVKAYLSDSVEGNAASNTAESASKLGKVLKGKFDEAQDVYEESIGATYE